MINLTISKYKEIKKKRANTIFLLGSANSIYVCNSKPTSKVSTNLYKLRWSHTYFLKCFLHLQSLNFDIEIKITENFPHTIYVFTNESPKCNLMEEKYFKSRREKKFSTINSMIIVEFYVIWIWLRHFIVGEEN